MAAIQDAALDEPVIVDSSGLPHCKQNVWICHAMAVFRWHFLCAAILFAYSKDAEDTALRYVRQLPTV